MEAEYPESVVRQLNELWEENNRLDRLSQQRLAQLEESSIYRVPRNEHEEELLTSRAEEVVRLNRIDMNRDIEQSQCPFLRVLRIVGNFIQTIPGITMQFIVALLCTLFFFWLIEINKSNPAVEFSCSFRARR